MPLAPGSWGGLTTPLHDVLSGTGRLPVGYHPELEVTYRDQLTSNIQVIAGRVADAAIPPGFLGVAVTQQTAARYALHPGSRLTVGTSHGPVDLLVTALVRARNPASTFWATDPLTTAPDLTENLVTDHFSVLAAALADPGQLAAVQTAFCPAASSGGCDIMQLEWEFPVAVGKVNADQAQAFANALAVAVDSPYSSELDSVASELPISDPMTDTLTAFITAQTAVLAVLLLLFASLAVIVVVVIMLAARIVVARRDDELIMLRHRGASGRQVAMRILAGVAPAVIPAAVAGAALVLAIHPRHQHQRGWKQAAAVLAVALAGPPLIAVWLHRRPSPAANPALILTPETRTPRASAAAQRRLMAGLTACAAAVGGLVVLRGQGLSPAGATNWYLIAAPILVAVPAALIAMRLYPLAIRALLPVCRRRAGVAGYVGLAGAVERRTSTALPAFTLVLALTLAAFGGMVNGSIVGGQITYSWQATGADAVIDTNGAAYDVTPAVEKSIMAIPGVRHSAAVWTTTWQTPLRAAAAQRGRGGPGRVRRDDRGHPVPPHSGERLRPSGQHPGQRRHRHSRARLAVRGRGSRDRNRPADVTRLMGPVRVRVAGIVARTPAEPAGGMFLIMPLRTLPGVLGQPTPNLALITGTDIDRSKLSRLIGRALPPATLTFRADVLNGLGSAPLQHAAALLMTLTAVIAGGLALLNLVFGLALGARDRELTLARLSVMGYERDTSLVLLMALPAVLAAFAAAAGCALALPALVSPALDLSVFTGPGASVTYRPDLAALGVPCLVILR